MDFVIAMEFARRGGTSAPFCGMVFQPNESANNWMDDTKGKFSSGIVRWMQSMAGTEFRNDD